jgi:hypothetical protein
MKYVKEKCNECGKELFSIKPIEYSSKKNSFLFEKKCVFCASKKIVDNKDSCFQPLLNSYNYYS